MYVIAIAEVATDRHAADHHHGVCIDGGGRVTVADQRDANPLCDGDAISHNESCVVVAAVAAAAEVVCVVLYKE